MFIQAGLRGYLVRNDLVREHAAFIIQIAFLDYLERVLIWDAAVTIQRWQRQTLNTSNKHVEESNPQEDDDSPHIGEMSFAQALMMQQEIEGDFAEDEKEVNRTVGSAVEPDSDMTENDTHRDQTLADFDTMIAVVNPESTMVEAKNDEQQSHLSEEAEPESTSIEQETHHDQELNMPGESEGRTISAASKPDSNTVEEEDVHHDQELNIEDSEVYKISAASKTEPTVVEKGNEDDQELHVPKETEVNKLGAAVKTEPNKVQDEISEAVEAESTFAGNETHHDQELHLPEDSEENTTTEAVEAKLITAAKDIHEDHKLFEDTLVHAECATIEPESKSVNIETCNDKELISSAVEPGSTSVENETRLDDEIQLSEKSGVDALPGDDENGHLNPIQFDEYELPHEYEGDCDDYLSTEENATHDEDFQLSEEHEEYSGDEYHISEGVIHFDDEFEMPKIVLSEEFKDDENDNKSDEELKARRATQEDLIAEIRLLAESSQMLEDSEEDSDSAVEDTDEDSDEEESEPISKNANVSGENHSLIVDHHVSEEGDISNHAVVAIQSLYRGYQIRRDLVFIEEEFAVMHIQAVFRGHRARCRPQKP